MGDFVTVRSSSVFCLQKLEQHLFTTDREMTDRGGGGFERGRMRGRMVVKPFRGEKMCVIIGKSQIKVL